MRSPSPKRPWAMIAIAFGCIAVLVLVAAVGIGIFAFTRDGDGDETAGPPESPTTQTGTGTGTTSETATEEGPEFEILSPIDTPPGDADDMRAVLADNPLTDGSMPTVDECTLPETPADHSNEELQAVLDAAGSCLSGLWATTSSDRGLPWTSPTVVVYEWPEIPEAAACEHDTFEEDSPRMCNLDATLYWPAGYGSWTDQSDPAELSRAYLWELAYHYMVPVMWHSSVGVYYSHLTDLLEGDQEAQNEAWRRYVLQLRCLSSAATMQMPEEAQPSQAFRDELTSEGNWETGTGDRAVEQSSRVRWVEAGFESGGDLSACNTWAAPAEEVA